MDVYQRSKTIYRHRFSYAEGSLEGDFRGEVYPEDEFISAVKSQFDRSYQTVKNKLERDLRIPVMPLDAARGTVPYDSLGYPLGDIEGASIPSSWCSGRAGSGDSGGLQLDHFYTNE